MSAEKLEPDFFVVGSQRCGTTWIDKALRGTGKVLLPRNKQTYFFDRNYDLGIAWYEHQFGPADNYEVIGEIATGYCLDGAIERLAKSYPDAKIILTVREPVSRAYSNYIKRRESYQGLSFSQAMHSDDDLIKRGLYGEMLERILKHYSSSKVKVVFFDDLESSPREFLNEITDFLNIDCEVDEKLLTQNVNSSLFEGISKFAKKANLYFVISFIKKIGLTSYVRKVIYKLHKVKKRPSVLIDPELHQFFSSSNKILGDICERDLGDWGK